MATQDQTCISTPRLINLATSNKGENIAFCNKRLIQGGCGLVCSKNKGLKPSSPFIFRHLLELLILIMEVQRNVSLQSTNANGSGGAPYWIDQSTFAKRLQALYSHWRRHKVELWGSADIFAIATLPPADNIGYLKSSKLSKWLLGYEFPETVTFFGYKQIHFLCLQKEDRLLETVKRSIKGAVDVDVVIHRKLKGEGGTSEMDRILHSMCNSNTDVLDEPIVGYIVKESPEGSLMQKWADKLKNCGLQLSDVTDGLSDLLAIEYPIEERLYQAELARELNVETASRLGKRDRARAYKKNSKELFDPPPHPKKEAIQFDQKNMVVLLRINGNNVPFHVSTVKRVSCLHFNKLMCNIRIIFNVPGTPSTPHDVNGLKHQRAVYLKDATLQSKDLWRSTKVVRQIRRHILRRNAVARESERAERHTEVFQAKLICARNKSNPIRLSHLCIHPPLGVPPNGTLEAHVPNGTLEAHVNGFRYITSRQGERVDIMYANIKHAFFQTEEMGKMNTLLHFHLLNHIMVGNKETKDVQFCMETNALVQTLGDATSFDFVQTVGSMDFEDFANRVDDLWSQPQFKAIGLKFEQPLEEFGFRGVVADKASAFIVPTSRCLVELILTPFLVIPLSEIEIVTFERIGAWQKDFDMAIVFKDFKRDVMRIDSIPSASFYRIKEWLHSVTDIEYFECTENLHWRAIMKTFIDDPQALIDVGGWRFLSSNLYDD